MIDTPRTDAVGRMAVGPLREAAILDHARNLERELIRLRWREGILVDALAEIKASIEGTSGQKVEHIVAGCILELRTPPQ